MADTKKPIAELRKELKHLMVDIQVAPSKIKNRQAIENMIQVYRGFSETKKENVPPPVLNKPGRKPARKIESETAGEVAVPKKVAPVEHHQEPEPKPKKISKADPPKVADDTPKPKPKRVMTEEHKAKMKAAREAKKVKSSASTDTEEELKKAEPKKQEPPPDAPRPREKKVPVFKMGASESS